MRFAPQKAKSTRPMALRLRLRLRCVGCSEGKWPASISHQPCHAARRGNGDSLGLGPGIRSARGVGGGEGGKGCKGRGGRWKRVCVDRPFVPTCSNEQTPPDHHHPSNIPAKRLGGRVACPCCCCDPPHPPSVCERVGGGGGRGRGWSCVPIRALYVM